MDLDAKARSIPEYGQLLDRMLEQDKARLEFSREMAKEMRLISRNCYSTMKYPVKLLHPMFEARAAYAVPNNYFQNLYLDEEKVGNFFSHGAMRSVFFIGEKLVLFSKAVNFRDGNEYFTSFILAHFEKGEYELSETGDEVRIKANVEKPMQNLITGGVERKRITFGFTHLPVEGRIVSKEQVAQSSRYQNVYGKRGARVRSQSSDLEGYAVTVAHFSPHPYMLQLHKEFGYEDNKDFQLHVIDYFKGR